MAALELAVKIYDQAIDGCVDGYQLPRRLLDYIFRQFRVGDIDRAWCNALEVLAPDTAGFELDSMEEKNIAHGLNQLQEAWTNPALMYDSTSVSAADFEEIFRTKGEHKKVLREIGDIKAETEKGL